MRPRRAEKSVMGNGDLCLGEKGFLVLSEPGKAFLHDREPAGKDPVHHRNKLPKFICVMMGVSLQFRGAPALLVRYAQLHSQGMLLGLLADLAAKGIERSAGYHDLICISRIMDRHGKGKLALELPMADRGVLVLCSVCTQGLVERPGIGKQLVFGRHFADTAGLQKTLHQPPHRLLHALGAVKKSLGDRIGGRVFLQDYAPLLERVEEFQCVVHAPEDKGYCQDVPDIIGLTFEVLAEFGEHALRALEPCLDLDDRDGYAVTAVEDETALLLLEGQRFLQLVEEGRDLHKGPLGRLIVRDMLRIIPVVMVQVIQTLALCLKKEAELGMIIDILTVLFDGLDKMSHLEHGTGDLLP